jgi:hypothetical protein
MKIGFTGTYSTGKSTLIEALTKELAARGIDHGTTRVSEAARASPFPLNREQTLDGSLWILAHTLAAELACSARHTLSIADRTVIDIWALARHAARERRGSADRADLIARIVRDWVRSYDLIFLTRIDPSFPPRPSRIPDPEFRLLVRDLQLDCIADLQLPVVELPHDLEQRLALILDKIAALSRGTPAT